MIRCFSFFSPSMQMCAGDFSGGAMDGSSTFFFFFCSELSAALKQSNGEKNIAVLGFAPLVIYGEDPSILLCSAGTSDAGGNSGKRWMETRQRPTPKPHHLPSTNMLVDGEDRECLRLLKYGASECASTHTYPHLDVHAGAHGKQTLL